MTNERELVNVLTKIFPTECWDAGMGESRLCELTKGDFSRIFKRLWLLDPSDKIEDVPCDEIKKSSNVVINECEVDDTDDSEQFVTDEFNKRHETMQLTSSELAFRILLILQKLVEIENATALGQTDQNSVTMCCLHFSLDTLGHLHDETVFNDADQTVIKASLMELTFLCFNNLVNRDGKAIEPVFKKLFHLLEVSDDNEISCGLILNILTILNNLCVKRSIQKSENLNMFILCNHLILRRMNIISKDKELLHLIHLLLIRIISNVRTAHHLRVCDKKAKKRSKTIVDPVIHHDSLADACIFERLLIESFPFVKSFRKLRTLLNNFRVKGICCCNGSVATIRIFLRSSLVPKQSLNFIKDKIIQPAFDKKICVFCNDKIESGCFKDEYFHLLRNEIQRRNGWELHALLHHLTAIHKIFSTDFLQRFVFDVIMPVFELEKAKFLADPEQNFEAKLIVSTCLGIINESVTVEPIMTQFFTAKSIQHLRDCSLVPPMASNACQLLKLAMDNVKLLASGDDIAKSINNILFSNVLYLIRELMEIYGQINLPKDVPLTSDKSAAGDASDFEILDEQTVAVKEALSDMDVLLLNTIHWNILCDLITSDSNFQRDFVANIYNNFSGNILFTIAYNALNSMLLKKELKSNFQITISSTDTDEPSLMFERCMFLTPVIISSYDVSFEMVIKRFYQFNEISTSFRETLQESVIYRASSDNDVKFRTLVHKDIFLTDNASVYAPSRIVDDNRHWLNQLWIGIPEAKTIRDHFTRIVNLFVHPEDELKAIHRANTIKDITGRCGIKYLSSIARNCFDICWRLSDNISFSEYIFSSTYCTIISREAPQAFGIPCLSLRFRVPSCLFAFRGHPVRGPLSNYK